MSHVTDVILLFSNFEEVDELPERDHYPIADPINAWLREHYDGDELNDLSDAASGGKAFQSVLHAGCFNYFDVSPFVEFLRTQPWEAPADVQLLIKLEEDSRFTMVEVFPPSEPEEAPTDA